jgi:hypothetical protein
MYLKFEYLIKFETEVENILGELRSVLLARPVETKSYASVCLMEYISTGTTFDSR